MVKGVVSDEPGDVYSQECGFSHEGIVIKLRVFRPCITGAVCNVSNLSYITDGAKA